MDFALFQWINNLSETLPWASPLMVFSAKYLPILFALTLVILWFTFDRKQQLGAFLAGVSALLALGSAQVIASLYPRPRPYITHAVHLLIERSQDPSFPSDHAVFSFAIAAMIWRYNRKVGNVLVGLAILIGFARVYVGTHYPLDVVGGAVLGILASIVTEYLTQQPVIAKLLNRLFDFLKRWHLVT